MMLKVSLFPNQLLLLLLVCRRCGSSVCLWEELVSKGDFWVENSVGLSIVQLNNITVNFESSLPIGLLSLLTFDSRGKSSKSISLDGRDLCF